MFPVNDPVSANSFSTSFGPIPLDTYSVSLLIQGKSVERQRLYGYQEARAQNAETPVQLSVNVTGWFGRSLLLFQGDTRHFILGERHNFSPEIRFEEYLQLLSPGENLEFVGLPFERYTMSVEFSRTDVDKSLVPEKVLVSGKRDNGYYPLGNMIALPALTALWLFVACIYGIYRLIRVYYA